MLSKIDSNDLTVQLESGKADVWVPEGLAIARRMQEEHPLVPANTMATSSMEDDAYTKFLSNNEWVFTFDGKVSEKPKFLDARVSGGDGSSASISKDFGRDVGPIAIQNKVPIPVSPGMQVSMAGVAKIRRTNLNHQANGSNTPVLVRFDLWAAGYEEDEYGEESDIKLNLMSFTQSLQNISGFLSPVGSALITFTLPTFDYMTVPQGCDRVFLTVCYVTASTSEYSAVSYNSEATGGFLSPRVEAPTNFAYLPNSNPLRILTKPSGADSIITTNLMSKTGAAFKNRAFFENVFPLFDYFGVQNSGFSDGFAGWTATGSGMTISTDNPHTATQCVKVVGAGNIFGPELPAVEGDRIYLSAWMRNVDFSGPGGLRIQKRVGTTWSDIGAGNATTANNQWIKSEIKAVVPADAEAIRLRVAFAGTGTIYFDDIEGAKLIDDTELTFMGEALSPSTQPPKEIPIPNGDFATTTDWDGLTTSDTITTEGFLRMLGNSVESHVYSTTPITVATGEQYYLTANWWKRTSYTGAGNHFIGVMYSSDGISWTRVPMASFLAGQTTVLNSKYSSDKIFTVPANMTKMKIYIGLSSDVTAGRWEYDNVKLSLMNPPGAPIDTKGANIEIYEWNGSRGALIKTDSVPANIKKTIEISSTTGMIEVVKPGAVTPANMGINKSGNQGPLAQNVWTKVTGFSVRPDMLGTNLSNDSFVMNFAGTITVEAYIKFAGSVGKHSKGVRVLKNGVLVTNSTFTTEYETTGMSGRTAPMTVAVGDVISFEGISNSTSAAQRTITEGTHFEIWYTVPVQAGNDFYIESVLAKEWDYLDQSQNRLQSIQYTNVVDDVSSVSIERSEADAGTMTLKFCSDNLDPRTNELLQIGKEIRILARHYGIENKSRPISWVGEALYEVVFVAKIKRIEVQYNYENEPQITVTAYDGFQKLDSAALGMAYDTIEEYGPVLNSSGNIVKIDGQDWSGPQSSLPGELKYFPSTYGQMSVMDALIMTRNSNKKYLWFNKKNELTIKSSLDDAVKLQFTDGTIAGDLSMGNVKQGVDTETIVNAIDIEENLLDRSSFTDRVASAGDPPEMFKTIEGKQRTVRYQDNASIAAFGEYSKKFQVVRGSGSYEDLRADNFGSSFIGWAEDILEDYSVPRIYISEMTSPVKDSATMYMLANLDILDKIWVHYQFDTYEVRVKSIKINITPGKWFYSYGFLAKSDQAYW